ncbi:hypothetical protein KM043_016223 [Ampulex compressa]|nr:hypothetical protein KM043_016223 [Ampulex compressa]
MAFNILLLLPLVALSHAELESKIVGGTPALPGEFPYQVSLQIINSEHHFCGGSILNEDYVITAAHCLTSKDPENIMVIAGTHDLRYSHTTHRVENIIIHEKYNRSDSWINDIALLKVQDPFVKSALVSFIRLPNPMDVVEANDVATVSGFGRLWFNGMRTKRMHWVNIFIADQKYCENMYKPKNNIYKTQICAYDPTAVRGACKGDSGGPLTVDKKLVGIVSWSKNCADIKYPSVYTRVVYYLDWIKQHAV